MVAGSSDAAQKAVRVRTGGARVGHGLWPSKGEAGRLGEFAPAPPLAELFIYCEKCEKTRRVARQEAGKSGKRVDLHSLPKIPKGGGV